MSVEDILKRVEAAQAQSSGAEGSQNVSEADRAKQVLRRAGVLDQGTLDRVSAANQKAEDRMTIAQTGGLPGGVAAKFVQGFPFVGEYVDEAFDALDPGRGERVRNLQGAMDREYPNTALTSEVGGGVIGSIPAAVAAGPTIAAAAPTSMTGQVLAGGGLAAIAGGSEGAIAGYGRGTNRKERRDNAITGGVVGTGLGAALGVTAPLAAKGTSNFINWLKSSEIGSIAKEFGISNRAAKIIRQSLDGEDMVRAQQRISAVGDNSMLADAGPQSAQLLDTIMSEGGEALTKGQRAISERAAVTTPALRRTFDAVLGAPKGVKTGMKDIAQGSARARSRAYTAAYNTPRPMVGVEAQAIDAALEKVPPNILREAVQEANDAMREAGTRNMNILAEIADDGSVTFSKPLNIQQLDEIKKALGTVAQNNTDPVTGKITAAGLRAQRRARELKKAISDAVPVYGRAVKLGGDKISEENALLLGRSALSETTTLEDVASAFADASKAEKTAFKQGLREAIEEQMSRVKGVASDPDTGAREALKIWKDLSSRKTRGKVEAAIGKPAAERIWKMMESELPMIETRAAVARGSQTAIRQSSSNAIGDVLEHGTVGKLGRGEAIDAGKSILQIVNNTTPGADRAARAKILGEVADVLTKRGDRGATRALDVVRKAMDGQQISEREATLIGRYVGSGVGLSGYQTGTQSLQQQ